ncbi:hemagglutinin repeat-containing protein [Leptotrichia wadei]|uniref:hemagglutinin repeat-containing protein n=1 Tax=Leptotrichia wadei TaxID=157687 RepID=UPI0028EE5D08|nr:hemagglutinin repeat-containing protein [Leptotrichia wadei]
MKHGLAGNQGTGQAYHTGNLSQSEVRNASANNNFYANIGVNAGYSTSKNSNNSHNESAVVTTMKPMNENSSITYNNVNNITYQGTQAQGGTFIYNNVKNIRKEAVELHNSSSSRSSNFGISTGATIGYGYGTQITGNGGSVSANRSNQNTNETIYQNGNFQNVNEVHNNTGTMTLSGFNQEGGKVTGNIGKVEVISRQNTSTTTGSSKGVNLGISANGVPSSVTINASRTNGNRAFVDNQSTFVVGEGSNLHVGTVENTGAVIGKEGNSTFKIDTYVGKDIQNYDTMTTTGGSIGASLGGKPKITNVGFNQDSRDKQGITRNTVVGDVEIAEAEGSPINRDLGKANEVTKDTHSRTNINVEPQVIEYLTNPGKLKEDIGKAKEEINDIKWAIKESIHDRGDDNRNFFGQLSEVRLDKSLENITSERLIGKTVDTEIAGIFKDAYKDLGYDINIIFSDPKNSPQLLDEKGKPKTGTAYVDDYGVKTIIINAQDPKNTTKAGLIGTIVEEGSHVIGKVEGRQRKTGTDEKGLESTGRASNEYFAQKYKDDNPNISIKSDGKDYSNVDFGENVGNIAVADDALIIVAGVTIAYIAGAYIVQQNGKTIGSYPDLKTAQKNAQYLLNKAGDGLKWIWNGGAWVVKKISNVYKAEHTKISEDKNTKNKHEKGKARKQRDQGGEKDTKRR